MHWTHLKNVKIGFFKQNSFSKVFVKTTELVETLPMATSPGYNGTNCAIDFFIMGGGVCLFFYVAFLKNEFIRCQIFLV